MRPSKPNGFEGLTRGRPFDSLRWFGVAHHRLAPFDRLREDRVGQLVAHAVEVVRDVDGQWYVSHCGWGQGGVYLAKFYWNDGLDDTDTSMPVPVLKSPPAAPETH
jgi:hypothetical protein